MCKKIQTRSQFAHGCLVKKKIHEDDIRSDWDLIIFRAKHECRIETRPAAGEKAAGILLFSTNQFPNVEILVGLVYYINNNNQPESIVYQVSVKENTNQTRFNRD